MFDRLVWHDDRLLLDDLVFRLQLSKNETWDLGDECFQFFKDKPLVDQYCSFFETIPTFSATNVLELGMWDRGSLAFWFKYFLPEKLVGVDLAAREDSQYFRSFLVREGIQERIKTYPRTDQADADRLQQIVHTEFIGDLDVVIDDASHLYGPTKASFEILFPLLRPGGLYIIEDWAWLHWAHSSQPGENCDAPTAFIHEITEATGTIQPMISKLTVVRGFAAVERSSTDSPLQGTFRLDDHIFRRPNPPRVISVARKCRVLAGRGQRWFSVRKRR